MLKPSLRTAQHSLTGPSTVSLHTTLPISWKDMEVGVQHAGETWSDLLGWHSGNVVIGDNGWATFRCSARSVSLWANNGARGREQFAN